MQIRVYETVSKTRKLWGVLRDILRVFDRDEAEWPAANQEDRLGRWREIERRGEGEHKGMQVIDDCFGRGVGGGSLHGFVPVTPEAEAPRCAKAASRCFSLRLAVLEGALLHFTHRQQAGPPPTPQTHSPSACLPSASRRPLGQGQSSPSATEMGSDVPGDQKRPAEA
ncbi:unnamed protein product [Pleuronectes platessa]|uniref:Uncharacterized protein n=1 Tax=Pleuronectes platessa TaxID=8262 RepID=A0A9N7YCB1_PLEPL|nr:unnamed protein product [Pleuronectes platessa]